MLTYFNKSFWILVDSLKKKVVVVVVIVVVVIVVVVVVVVVVAVVAVVVLVVVECVGALINNIKYILVKHPYGRSMLEKRNAKRSVISSIIYFPRSDHNKIIINLEYKKNKQ